MKHIFFFTLLTLVLDGANAQREQLSSGGGEYVFETTEDKCLSDIDRAAIQRRLEISRMKLEAEGKLNFSGDREEVQFIWPVRNAAELNWNSSYGISAHVDQDPGAEVLDYECSFKTYGGHFGTDIFTWPYPWYLVDNDLVEVVAGFEGVIIEKDDGFEDDHCECIGSWNAVYVQHADGSVAWYGHMKKGSLTTKSIGETVNQGEFLGIVASSGCSSGPHLHLEVYDSDVQLVDPYEGACNSLNADTWWLDQKPHWDPTINTILTHDALPEHGCPSINENPHFQDYFFPGDLIYIAGYFHDAIPGTVTDYRVLTPDGGIWAEWSTTNDTYYNASWWWWSWTLPFDSPTGEWILEATCEGDVLTHPFYCGVYASVEEEKTNQLTIFPNPTNQNLVQIDGLTQPVNAIYIFDLAGKMVSQTTIESGILDVSNLEKGIYFVQLQAENELIKLVIN